MQTVLPLRSAGCEKTLRSLFAALLHRWASGQGLPSLCCCYVLPLN